MTKKVDIAEQLTADSAPYNAASSVAAEQSSVAEHEQQSLELALWASQEAIWHWRPLCDTFAITRFKRDRTKDKFNGSRADFIQSIHPDDLSLVEHQLAQHMQNVDGVINVAFRFYHKDQWRWLRMRGQANERDATGMALQVVGTIRDISEQQEQLSRLDHLARYDALTGLLNRRTLLSELQKWASSGAPFCLVFVDLDGFKLLNDTLGHVQGDAYLQSVADTLRRELPKTALIARYGGDEFVCAFHFTAGNWQQQVNRLVEVRTPFNFNSASIQLKVTGSLGVALFPEHTRNIDELMEFADCAMYQAKAAGKDGYALYQAELYIAKKRKITMISELRTAVQQRTLKFELQPKFNASSQMTGAELLCRWHSDTFGQVSPAIFIPLLEEHGLAEALALLALNQAADYLDQLLREAKPVLMAVNISAELITKAGFLDTAAAIFDRRGLDKSWIELEITESVFLQEAKKAEMALQQLRNAGFRVAMDDFGTGYSSLSYISRYQFDTIKIDQSFIQDMLQHQKSRLLVEGIVSICRTLGINVVAEGVETEQQFQFLKSLGVQRFQGFYLAKPQLFSEIQQQLTYHFASSSDKNIAESK